MQKKTISSENSSVEVQSKHSPVENTCVTSSMHNRVSIPPKRFRFGLSDDGERSYLQGSFSFNVFGQEFTVHSGFYTSQEVWNRVIR